ncbi:hypothetical protein ENKNEFLB_01405 [Nocardioides aquaticus]|uniref:Uncharacterized protein n=1 Tax=Nocardioides aquaticus TaxID=160826 RepID=A0ABX8EGM0_9ACTN|nr:hypothetical protein [Nocardioides aquaticus]QVT79025.1 hypothetical protein ENKNEFLB_01405 [Nocardioides aquaticus]
MTATNDARALHDLLSRAIEMSDTVENSWGAMLAVEATSREFTRRHAEVVGLYTGTLALIESLPEAARERAARYDRKWWTAIVAPRVTWHQNTAMVSVVDRPALDQLASFADLVEARLENSLAVPGSTDLTELRAVVDEWLVALAEEKDLPAELRSGLIRTLTHVVWLIDNVDLFGVGRVAAAATEVVGEVAVVGQRLPPATRGEWVERGKKLIRVLVLLGGIASGVDVSLALTAGAVGVAGELLGGLAADPGVEAPGPADSPGSLET